MDGEDKVENKKDDKIESKVPCVVTNTLYISLINVWISFLEKLFFF